jgi:ubiquinone/menaquinone biosynthesis C-methylase UbiE
MTNTFGNFESSESRSAALREMVRVLKPGGKLIISVYSDQARSIDVRRNSYEELGMIIKSEQRGTFVTEEGLFSHAFAQDALHQMLAGMDLTVVDITNLTGMGFFAVASKTTVSAHDRVGRP